MTLATRRFVLATAALAAAFCAGHSQAQSALDGVMKAKLIKVAVPTDFPPYGFVGIDMKPQGLDVDMAKLIADKLGVKLELVPVTSANRVPYLQTRKADLVISTLGKNAEREKVIDFSAAYAPFFQAVYGPKSAALADFGALAGKTIAVTRGAIEDQELSKLAPAQADIKRFEDNNATVAAFVSGQTQYVATGVSVADNMIKRNPALGAEYKLLLKDSPNFIGLAKGEDALRQKVNEVVLAAKQAGELDALSKKWLGRPTGTLPE